MRRLSALVLTVVLGLGALPASAAERPAPAPGTVKRTVHVEIKGKLEDVLEDILLPFDAASITVNGQTYWLNLGNGTGRGKQATRLMGKTVIVTGTLQAGSHARPVVHVTGLKSEEFLAVSSWNAVAAVGQLEVVKPLCRCRPRYPWLLRVDGVAYYLDLSEGRTLVTLAHELAGKPVRVTGTLHTDTNGHSHSLGWDRAPEIKVIRVKTLEAVESEYVRTTERMEITGTLTFESPMGCPPQTVTAISADGQMFLVDFGKSATLRQRARELDGKSVVLTGTVVGKRQLCACDPRAIGTPVIRLTDLKAAEAR